VGSGHWLGLPMPVWISGVIVAVFTIVLKRTRFGRHVYAVGGNERAAALSGLNVNRIKLAVYTAGGALAGMAGLLVTARRFTGETIRCLPVSAPGWTRR